MRNSSKHILALCLLIFVSIASCKKKEIIQPLPPPVQPTNGTNTYSSDVVIKWLDVQYRIFILPQEQNSSAEFLIARFFSAVGITLYESVVPGMPSYSSLSGQLQQMPTMPSTFGGSYHWSASANAAIANIYRLLLPNASTANKALIDSLENALNTTYQTEVDAPTFQRSADFGKAVAQAVFDWIQTDGTYNTYPTYVPPVGPGLWIPTPPSLTSAKGVHWGDLRTNMAGVADYSAPASPIDYSTDATSAFYNSMKDVYNTKQQLTADPALLAQVNYWRGTQGGSGVILWYNILRKILAEKGNAAMLDKAALAWCKMGIAQKDAVIASYKAKYKYNQLAPITYIRNVLGYTTWNAVVATPATPCYPETHAPQSTSSSAALITLFGSSFPLNTTGINDLPGYNFNSLQEANQHSCESRFYAGVGTRDDINAGIWIGNKTVEYMEKNIKFLK